MNGLHFILNCFVLLLRLLRPGGLKAVAAENLVLHQQVIAISRHQKRSPKLKSFDRILFGFLTALIPSKRFSKIAIALKPATLLKFHRALVKRKYHLLFSSKKRKKSGPKGPAQAVIDAIIQMKQRNPRFGYRRIAMQMIQAFGVDIDKDVVRRILAKHYKPPTGGDGPSWLTFLGHMKDSLWSIDFFRTESVSLRTHWVEQPNAGQRK